MRDKTTPDYYHALGLAEDATAADIRRQYRLLSKTHHPDMGGSQQAMAKINQAYGVLSDPFKRRIYDAERRRSLHVPSRQPEQPMYAPPRRQPAPRRQPHFSATAPKRRTSWWVKLVWGFTVLVLGIGLLMQLPLAQSNATSDPPANRPKPLSVTHPADQSSATATPAITSYSTADETPQDQPTTSTPVPQNSTCSTATGSSECYSSDPPQSCSDESCAKQQTPQNCVTKTYGLYRHTACSSPNGSNTCTNNSIGNYRYSNCH